MPSPCYCREADLLTVPTPSVHWDPIPSHLHRNGTLEIIPYLAHIISFPLITETFPSPYKHAAIIQLMFEKKGEKIFKKYIYIYIYLAVTGLSCHVRDLLCGMQDLVP